MNITHIIIQYVNKFGKKINLTMYGTFIKK
jgi:predicted SpoU family rRNA methylase